MTGKYIGIIDGTNKGQCVLTLKEENGKTGGIIFVYDIKFRNLDAKVEITILNNQFTGKAYDFRPGKEGNPKIATLTGEILENGEEIKGEWETDIQTKGEFHLFKHNENLIAPPPTAFLIKKINLPACKLDVNGLAGLLALMREGIDANVQPTFNINCKGSSFLKVGIDAFIKDRAIPKVVNDMTISFNEYNINKGYRVVNLIFKPEGNNEANVSGDNPTWVNGRAAEIFDYIGRYKSQSNIIFTKGGPVINSIIFLLILVWLPSIGLVFIRGILVGITVVMLLLLSRMYNFYFPQATIYLGEKQQNFWEKNKDAILAGIVTTIITALLAYLGSYFVSHWNEVASSLGFK